MCGGALRSELGKPAVSARCIRCASTRRRFQVAKDMQSRLAADAALFADEPTRRRAEAPLPLDADALVANSADGGWRWNRGRCCG